MNKRDIRAIHLDNTQFEEKPAEQVEVEPGELWDLPEYTPPVKVYDGIIRLRRSRYLHLDVDFAYFPEFLEQPDLAPPEGTADYDRLWADYVRADGEQKDQTERITLF